jgi:IS1 family transposase
MGLTSLLSPEQRDMQTRSKLSSLGRTMAKAQVSAETNGWRAYQRLLLLMVEI